MDWTIFWRRLAAAAEAPSAEKALAELQLTGHTVQRKRHEISFDTIGYITILYINIYILIKYINNMY